ncbi:hypothetical protein LTR78_007495 [Recurvomyces mirabilis]|uniref:Peptidase S53 domain-containing protein n=2 Tax=Recurvomyces mirabilis TaxID=574656 RepID=A0AAE0TUF8_9PEZI|nr:hypothetical protein LTR78_007495 [Recurvomyces mirabilis]
MDIAHPTSPNYGKHLSANEVRDMFAPADSAIEAVRSWLLSAGIDKNDILPYHNKGWLAVNLPASKAELLLRTEYYEHDTNQGLRLGCEEYYLPGYISEHVDLVKPGVVLSAPMRKSRFKRDVSGLHRPGPGQVSGRPGRAGIVFNPHPHWVMPSGAHGLPPDLQNCSVNITPTCIQALYGIPRLNFHDPVNKLGLFETADTFAQADIDLDFQNVAPWVPTGTTPEVNPLNTGESDVDIELAQSLIYPQTVVVYQIDDLPNALGETGATGVGNTFIDSVDGSYCNFTAFGITGDSPGIDPEYPNTNFTGGYTGQRMKLGLQGHTIVTASGDYGVADNFNRLSIGAGCLSGSGLNGTIYNPDYPSACPYVTSVGQTRLYDNQTVRDRESAGSVNLTAIALETGYSSTSNPSLDLFGSGGSFSNYFARPGYQMAAVSKYLSEDSPSAPSYVASADANNLGEGGGLYNRAGRGSPDVSANGAFLLGYTNLTQHWQFGTSLATPIFASVINLINEERTAAGKGPVGFVNSVLYQHPEVLNDVVNGSNPGCGSAGFQTASGWDSVTGLGTPNYPRMRDLFLSLP